MANYEFGIPIWETPMHHGADLLHRLLDAGWPEGIVLNVNFPVEADLHTRRVVTDLAVVGYDRLFRRSEEGRFGEPVQDRSGIEDQKTRQAQ